MNIGIYIIAQSKWSLMIQGVVHILTSSIYIDAENEKYPKFEVGDHVRIWKYKNIFFFWLKNLKILYHVHSRP